jgi:hypothetical protein
MGQKLVFFDNSALTRIFEMSAGDRSVLVTGLKVLGGLRVTALNVYETARTPATAVRVSKLRFYREVSEGVPPIADPMALLASLARSWRFETIVDVPIDELAHKLLAEPNLATDAFSKDLTEQFRRQERDYATLHTDLRPLFHALYAGDHKFDDESSFIETMMAAAPVLLQPLIAEAFRNWTDTELQPGDTADLLDDSDGWRVFMAAQIHTMWLRSAQSFVASSKRLGMFDTDTSVYLPFCDYFVTNDRAQLVTLSVANNFNRRRTQVELYDELKSRLMLS